MLAMSQLPTGMILYQQGYKQQYTKRFI